MSFVLVLFVYYLSFLPFTKMQLHPQAQEPASHAIALFLFLLNVLEEQCEATYRGKSCIFFLFSSTQGGSCTLNMSAHGGVLSRVVGGFHPTQSRPPTSSPPFPQPVHVALGKEWSRGRDGLCTAGRLTTLDYTHIRNQPIMAELHHLSPFSRNTCQVASLLACSATGNQTVYQNKIRQRQNRKSLITQIQYGLCVVRFLLKGIIVNMGND